MLLTKLIRTSAAALGTLAVASITQANAADIYSGGGGYKDIPVATCCSFSGFYVGGAAGMAFSQIDLNGATWNDEYWHYGSWHANSGTFSGKNLNSTNGIIGGQFGYNWQNSCCYLFGIEVDLGAIGVNNNSHRYLTMNDRSVEGVSIDGKNNDDAVFAGDVTGRVGYTFGNSLIYVKGGFAFIDANQGLSETIYWNPRFAYYNSLGASNTYGNNSGDNWLTGWTVGAGWEWKPCCQSNWSIKIEYLHYDFSNNNNNNNFNDYFVQNYPGISNRFRNNDLTSDTVKIGFNYFLNPAPVAVPLK